MIRGWYSTECFADRFPDYATFKQKYETCGLPDRLDATSEYDLSIIFTLLASTYWEDHFKSDNSPMVELKIFRTIWEHGPKWQRDMALYDKLRTLTDEELAQGTQAIHNHAEHPAKPPVTTSTEPLGYIDSQNVTTYKKPARDKFIDMLELENSDVTKEFINRFSGLFVDIIYNGYEPMYSI